MKFTPAEWTVVRRSPLLVFYFVANVDEHVDSAEVNQLLAAFNEPTRYRSDLFTQIVADLMKSPEELQSIGESVLQLPAQDVYDEVKDLQNTIDQHLDNEQAIAFKKALIMFGTDIAAASGEAELPVSKEEWTEVATFKKLLKL